MHGSSNRDPVEIRWRDSVLSVARIFLVSIPCMEKDLFPRELSDIGDWRTCGLYIEA